MKRDLFKTFMYQIFSKPPKTFQTIKITYKHIDETWSIDLAFFQITKFQIIKDLDTYFLQSITLSN